MPGHAFPVKFLDRARSLYGGAVGVVDGERRLTYGEFGARVDRLSHALASLGIGKGDRVACLAANCHPLLEAYYGVVQVGAILSPFNIRLAPADFEFMLNDLEAKAILVERPLRSLVDPIRNRIPSLRHAVFFGPGDRTADPDYETLLAAAPGAPFPRPAADEDDVAEVFYTSGTTGKSKGVMLTHRNLYANGLHIAQALRLTDRDVMLHTIPLFHANGWGIPHALTGMGGRHVCLAAFEPRRVLEAVARERVTLMGLVPTMVNVLLNFPDLDRHDRSSLTRVLVGGAPPPLKFVGEIRRRLGCEYIGGYGMTETSPLLTISTVKATLAGLPGEAQERLLASTGLPAMGVEVRVVDEQGAEVARDGRQAGEIIARGDMVMKGYWRRPQDTAQTIRDGWIRTGDVATVGPEGYITIVDRAKDIIISGGENVSSVEIEDVLYRHPAVLEAAVVAAPDPKWGEIPVAVVVRKPGQAATEDEILAFARERLAHFKAPRRVDFADALPKGGTGKILKHVLREKYWSGQSRRVN